jgi:hypothetical protein
MVEQRYNGQWERTMVEHWYNRTTVERMVEQNIDITEKEWFRTKQVEREIGIGRSLRPMHLPSEGANGFAPMPLVVVRVVRRERIPRPRETGARDTGAAVF